MVKLTEVEDEHFTSEKPIPSKDALLVSDNEEEDDDDHVSALVREFCFSKSKKDENADFVREIAKGVEITQEGHNSTRYV